MDRSKFTGGVDISALSPSRALLKSAIDLLATMGEEAFELLVALLLTVVFYMSGLFGVRTREENVVS